MAQNQTNPVFNGIILSGTPVVVPTPLNMQIPGSITLKSSAAGRLIELSVDGGIEYFTPVLDVQSATMQILVVNAPITHFRVTGQANDTYTVS